MVNTAARLQSVAPPGTVLVGEATRHAASASIEFEPAGEQLLKGKSAPVPAFRAVRVVSQRGGQGRSELPEPPFVGRDEELRLLKDLIALSGREPKTRLVSITGPAGIGKSRLAWELEKYLDGSSRPSTGIAAARRRMARASRSGRWARSSAGAWASPRPMTRPRPASESASA